MIIPLSIGIEKDNVFILTVGNNNGPSKFACTYLIKSILSAAKTLPLYSRNDTYHIYKGKHNQ